MSSIPNSSNIFDTYTQMVASITACSDIITGVKIEKMMRKIIKSAKSIEPGIVELSGLIGSANKALGDADGDLSQIAKTVESMCIAFTKMDKTNHGLLAILSRSTLEATFTQMGALMALIGDIWGGKKFTYGRKTYRLDIKALKQDLKQGEKLIPQIQEIVSRYVGIMKQVGLVVPLYPFAAIGIKLLGSFSKLLDNFIKNIQLQDKDVEKQSKTIIMVGNMLRSLVVTCVVLALGIVPMMLAIPALLLLQFGVIPLINLVITEVNTIGRGAMKSLKAVGIITLIIGGIITIVALFVVSKFVESALYAIAGLLLATLMIGILVLITRLIGSINVAKTLPKMTGLLAVTITLVLICAVLVAVGALGTVIPILGILKMSLAVGIVLLIVTLVGVVMSAVGPYIILGVVALLAISITMILVGTALALLSSVAVNLDEDSLARVLRTMGNGMRELFSNFGVLNPISLGIALMSISLLTPIILQIGAMALVLKSISSLKIPTGFDKNGRPTGYEKMSQEDFQTAAANCGSILTFFVALFKNGSTKLANGTQVQGVGNDLNISLSTVNAVWRLKRIARQIGGMASILTKVASLKFPTEFDKDGNAVKWESMSTTDFVNAAVSCGSILTFFVALFRNGNTKLLNGVEVQGVGGDLDISLSAVRATRRLKRITRQIGGMAKLLSEMAALKMPVEFDKDGNSIKWQKMSQGDFMAAAINSGSILGFFTSLFKEGKTTLLNGVEVQGVGSDLDNITLSTTIKMRMVRNIVKQMGAMAGTLTDIASLKIPVEFNPDGSPKAWKAMTSNDFMSAAANGVAIASLFAGVMGDSDTSVNIFEGGTQKAVKLSHIDQDALDNISLKSTLKMGFLRRIVGQIGSMAATLQEIASLSMITEFNPDGTAKTRVKMTANDFILAAANCGAIVHVFSAMMSDKATKIKVGASAITIGGIGNLESVERSTAKKFKTLADIVTQIGNMAQVVANIASLKTPTEFNEDGTPKAFSKLTEGDFLAATRNGESIARYYMALMEDGEHTITLGSGKKITVNGLDLSALENVKKSSIKKIELIGSIVSPLGGMAETIGNLAYLKCPSGIDPVTGETTGWHQIQDGDFTAAADNIKLLMGFFTAVVASDKPTPSNKKGLVGWVENGINTLKKGASDVADVAAGGIMTGKLALIGKIVEMVSSMAGTIADIAVMKMPTGFNADGTPSGYIQMKTKDITQAGDNVQRILSAFADPLKSPELVNSLRQVTFVFTDDFIKKVTTGVGFFVGIGDIEAYVKNFNGYVRGTVGAINTNINKDVAKNITKWGLPTMRNLLSLFNDNRMNTTTAESLQRCTVSTIKLIGAINGANLSKLKEAARTMESMAEFSGSIHGNFDKLADTINDKIVKVIEELNETIDNMDKTLKDVAESQTKAAEAFSNTQSSPSPEKPSPTTKKENSLPGAAKPEEKKKQQQKEEEKKTQNMNAMVDNFLKTLRTKDIYVKSIIEQP